MKKWILIVFLLISPLVSSQSKIIRNTTDKEYIDNVILRGLDTLGIDKVRITVKPLKESGVTELESRYGSELRGFIIGYGKKYTIYVGDYSRYETIQIIAHELIHLKQYYTGELEILGNDVYYRDGIYKRAKYIQYNYRPWERDAHREGVILFRKIKF